LWTPADTTTALWLDISDTNTTTVVSGSVSQANDKSGNGLNFSQPTSLWRPPSVTGAQNGLNAASFSPLTDIRSLQNASSNIQLTKGVGRFVVLMVAKRTIAIGSNYRILLLVSRNGASGSARAGFYSMTNTSIEAGGRRLDSDSYQGYARTGLTLDRWNILAADFNFASADLQVGINGDWAARSGGFQSAGNVSDTSPPDVDIGGRINAAATSGYEIGEIVAAHSGADIQKHEGYLAWKWDLENLLPSGHPYKNAAPTV
jgi:hypothetical protein